MPCDLISLLRLLWTFTDLKILTGPTHWPPFLPKHQKAVVVWCWFNMSGFPKWPEHLCCFNSRLQILWHNTDWVFFLQKRNKVVKLTYSVIYIPGGGGNKTNKTPNQTKPNQENETKPIKQKNYSRTVRNMKTMNMRTCKLRHSRHH